MIGETICNMETLPENYGQKNITIEPKPFATSKWYAGIWGDGNGGGCEFTIELCDDEYGNRTSEIVWSEELPDKWVEIEEQISEVFNDIIEE